MFDKLKDAKFWSAVFLLLSPIIAAMLEHRIAVVEGVVAGIMAFAGLFFGVATPGLGTVKDPTKISP